MLETTAGGNPDVRNVAFDHIAVAVHRIDDALPFLVGELGGRPAGGGGAEAFAFRQWTLGGGRFEVLEPAGPQGGFLHRFLERRGPGVHHVTFVVPHLASVCSRAEELGFPVVGLDLTDPEWKEAFLHPKEAMSIVVQLVERGRPAESDATPRVHSAEPGDPEPGPLGIDLVGLRLGARDLDRARRLWCDLLGGTARLQDGALDVRWPGSVLRLVVRRVGAAEPEGPIAVEVACLRPAVLPQDAHTVLGTVFHPVDITELAPPPFGDEGDPGGAAEGGRDGGSDPSAGVDGDAAGAPEDDTYFLDGDALERGEGESQ